MQRRRGIIVGLALVAAACADMAAVPYRASVGSEPQLPPAKRELIPTVNIAEATGWPANTAPVSPAGLTVTRFAGGLEHPRWLHVLPNGDVLVAETAAPPRPEDGKGVKGFFMKIMMKKAGSAVPSANRITLLRDADGDGIAERREIFLQGLNSPFGMALIGDDLYVANTDAVVRFPYQTGDTRITAAATKVVDLPGGPLNHHWTKNIIASRDGSKLYATVGSNSNVGRERHRQGGRARRDLGNRFEKPYASGLRFRTSQPERPRLGA